MTGNRSDASAATGGRALVVGVETSALDTIRHHLDGRGLRTETVNDGREALLRTRQTRFTLIILRAEVAGLDGVTLCRSIRQHGPNEDTPVVLLTPRGVEADRVLGLESGADDCVDYPFDPPVFCARVSAVLRRSHAVHPASGPASRILTACGLTLDPARRLLTVSNRPVSLTTLEFDLLFLLVRWPGVVFSRATLVTRVWGDPDSTSLRTVDCAVNRIRKKIERDPRHPRLLLTVWGGGYKFSEPD